MLFTCNKESVAVLFLRIRESIIRCHNAGLRIRSVTVDGTAHNISGLELLGVVLTTDSIEKLKSYFPHPDQNIAAFMYYI